MVAPGKPTGISGEEYGVLKRFEKISPHLGSNQYILDIGCGYGAYTKLFKEYGRVIVGIDKIYEYLHVAKSSHPELVFF